MADDDCIALNDGTSIFLLNDGTSCILLNTQIEEAAVKVGGLPGRLRRRIFPRPRFIKEEKFSKRLIAKPFKILTFVKDIRLVPTLTQYKRIDYRLIGYPHKDTEWKFVPFKINPTLNKNVKIADIKGRPKGIERALRIPIITVNPIYLTSFSKNLKARTLHGINIIRKAIKMENELSFSFNEASNEWVGSKIYTDAAKFLQFDQPSSFVGNVVYEKETEELQIVLGDSVYNFCSVPRVIYDGFRKASSKGKYFNSFIKGLWDC